MMWKKLTGSVLIVMAALLFAGLMPVHGEEEIYDAVIRLHVLANSDSAEDQALKLEVRNAVLEVTAPLLKDCSDRAQAERLLENSMEEIQTAAERVIADAGRDDSVELLLSEESYPERNYDSFCFPAGSYLSLRVCIGEAAGQNWWCCLFPPLCLGAASVPVEEAEDSFIEVGLTPEQYKIITETDNPGYKIRFKLLELLN